MSVNNYMTALYRLVQEQLRKPYGRIVKSDLKTYGKDLAASLRVNAETYRVICDNTNNSEESIRNGEIRMTIKFKFQEDEEWKT